MSDQMQPDITPWCEYLVFDTETTGLFQFKDKVTGLPVPADDPSQPRLASFAAIGCDAFGREVWRMKRYVKPDGWSMPAEAGAINGLTDAFLTENGVPVADILDAWEAWVAQGLIFVAFNAAFDTKMMRAELRRSGRSDHFEETRNSCAMRSLAPYGQHGLCIMRGYVKLSEARLFFGIVNENPHDAMADAADTAELLRILIRDGNLIQPQVHYNSKHPGRESGA